MAENTLIYSFQKNDREQVKICLSNFMGNDLIDVRIYYLDGGSGEKWNPTKKGICVRMEHIESLL